MTTNEIPHPPIVSHDQWLGERKNFSRTRKNSPGNMTASMPNGAGCRWSRSKRDYVFEGPGGKRRLKDLFEGRRQLVIYHFMFDPSWEKGCPGCTGYAECHRRSRHAQGNRDTTFAFRVARAAGQARGLQGAAKGWSVPWYSSFGSDFNYDFHVTNDEKVAPVEYNYRNKAELEANKVPNAITGEEHGLSVFFRIGDDVFHTYSAYARGTEALTDARALLDMTPYGRQQDFEDSPPGWPQKPTYG